MSEFFGEATVKLRPDLTGFATELRAQIKAAVESVETGSRPPVVRIRPALTRNFVGDLRKQVNDAVARAQRGVKPIQIRAVLTDVSQAAIAREVRTQTRQLPLAGGITAAATQSGALARGLGAVQDASADLLDTERLLNSQFGRQATFLGQVAVGTAAVNKERAQGAASVRGLVQDTARHTASMRALTEAEIAAVSAQSSTLSLEERLRFLRQAHTTAVRAEAIAIAELAAAETAEAQAAARATAERAGLRAATFAGQVSSAATALDRQREAIAASTRALRESAREASSVARSQAQLRRGALSTSLSFLGIRGATLAASASFLAGAAAIAVFAKALDNATRFTDQLNIFRATTGSTAEELERVRETARALGADLTLPGVTAADAAEAMTELAKAGLDVTDSIEGARGVLELATAAAIENAQAVELVANALNAFGLQGRDATVVADTFANAANAAQGSIVDIGIAFQQAAAAGRQTGLTFQDTTTFLTILQREGLRGSDAGTSLRTALIRLIRPTKEARERLRELGVEVRDAQGNLRPDVFIQIARATENLSPAARDATIALVGGQDAFRAISILGRQSIQGFIRLRRELREQGTAGELAAARMQGLRGSLEGLGNVLSTIGVRIGQGLTPALQGAVDGVANVTVAVSDSQQTAQIFSGAVTAIELSFSALGTTLATVAPLLTTIAGGLAQVTNSVGVPTILAAIAAYKILPAVFARATASATALAAANTRLAFTFRLLRDPAITGRMAFLASTFNLVTLAVAAAAAAFIFFQTRESELERATRKLTEATEGLVDAQVRLRTAVSQQRRATTGVSQTRLDLFNAEQAVAAARSRLAQAPRNTQERTRAELELAVALDDVAAAQQRVNDASREAADARIILLNAQRREKDAREEEIESLTRLTEASLDRARILTRNARGPGQLERTNTFAVRAFTEELDKQIKKLRESDDVDALMQANRLERLRGVVTALNRLPDEQAIEVVVNAPDAKAALQGLIREFGVTGQQAVAALRFAVSGEGTRQMATALRNLLDTVARELGPKANETGRVLGFEHGRGIAQGITDATPEVENAVAGAITRGVNRLRGLERQATRLEIAGASPEERLANARRREQQAREVLARLEARNASEESINRALDALAAIVNERRAIEEEIRAAHEKAADEAKKAADAADEAALAKLERRRNVAEERLADARETEALADDIRRTVALRNLIRRQINRIRDLIKDRETEAQAIRALQAIERDLNRDIRDLQRDRRQQISERIAESIQLDIEFGQITENARIEINARKREIARLRKLQADTKRGTIEYRRYRNLIAEQQKAIEELTEQQKDKNNAFAEMSFQFLQAQSGFVANLLGNLIPLSATSGLVGGAGAGGFTGFPTPTGTGGPSGVPFPTGGPLGTRGAFPEGRPGGPADRGVAQALDRAGKLKDATGGPTRGGQATELQLLRNILAVLQDIRRGTTHKNAQNRRGRDLAAMELAERM